MAGHADLIELRALVEDRLRIVLVGGGARRERLGGQLLGVPVPVGLGRAGATGTSLAGGAGDGSSADRTTGANVDVATNSAAQQNDVKRVMTGASVR